MKSDTDVAEPAAVVPVENESESTCPCCSYGVVTLYRLESEDREDAVCGDCFASWLVTIGASVV